MAYINLLEYKNNPDVKFAQIVVWIGLNSSKHLMRSFWGKLRLVTLREFFLENFAGDLEYHPRRAMIYLGLGGAALCFWIFSPQEAKFSTVPLVFALGSVALLLKGIFLLRKSSEGLGLSQQELDQLSDPSNRKRLPSLPNQAAQIVQDFGVGSFLLWPILSKGKDIDYTWINPPQLRVLYRRRHSILRGLDNPTAHLGICCPLTHRCCSSPKRYTTMRRR